MSTQKLASEPLRKAREACGLLQSELAAAVGLTRQSINAIETGRTTPGVDVALRIAAILAAPVEELFQPPSATGCLRADAAAPLPAPGGRVALAQLNGRFVAYPLQHALFGRAADGIVRRRGPRGADIEPLASERPATENVVLMGCAAALGLLAERLNLRPGRGRFLWFPSSSVDALAALARQHAHVAGVHLVDPQTGEANLPDVQRYSGPGARALVTLARWEVGLVVAKGNPQRLRSIDQLVQRVHLRRPVRPGRPSQRSRREEAGLRLVAREKGSGARRLFERELERAGAPASAILATARLARGHMEVAQAIALGAADAGLATRDVALAYDLDFVPVSEERYDLTLPTAGLGDARLQRLFDALTSAAFRRDLTALGYDARPAGDRVGEVQAA